MIQNRLICMSELDDGNHLWLFISEEISLEFMKIKIFLWHYNETTCSLPLYWEKCVWPIILKIQDWVLSILFYYSRAIMQWKEIWGCWGVSYMKFYALFQFFSFQRSDFLALLFGLFILFCFLFRALNNVSKFEVRMNWTPKRKVIINTQLLSFVLYLLNWKGKENFRICLILMVEYIFN